MNHHIILYVSNQQKSKEFYSALLQKEPILNVEGMTEFELSKGLILGLMPETGIAKILGKTMTHPCKGNGIPRCELYLPSEDAFAFHKHALLCGAKEISSVSLRDWGDFVGYSADPDGHILAGYSKV